MTILSIDDSDNRRIVKTMKNNGFKSKKEWIRWAIKRQLEATEKALNKIEGTAIDETGVPALPEYSSEKEFKFYLCNGEESIGRGIDVEDATRRLGLKSSDYLDCIEL